MSPSLLIPDGVGHLRSSLSGGGAVSPARVAGLREALAQVPDPRRARGTRHSLASVLLIVICGLVADKDVYTTIQLWAACAPPELLAAMDVRYDPVAGGFVVPAESTLRKTIARVDPRELARCCDQWLDQARDAPPLPPQAAGEREARRARAAAPAVAGGLRALAGDGKRLAGAARPDGSRVNLLHLADHATGQVLARCEIGDKTNEIPELRTLLAGRDLTGTVITMDALHTQRETAEAIVAAGGHYVMTVKGNQPTLAEQAFWPLRRDNDHYRRLGRLASTRGRGHGREEHRIIRTADADPVDFPHAAQVFHLAARRRPIGVRDWGLFEHAMGVTSLPAHSAGPALLLHYKRGHWAVENKVHYIRDVTFGEDRHQLRTGHGPANLACARDLAISTLRAAGHHNIAHARALHSTGYHHVAALFNLT